MSPTVAIMHFAGPPFVGGVEITISAHARLLAGDGAQVRLLVGRGGPAEGWASPAEAARIQTIARPGLGSRGERLERIAAELAAGRAGPGFAQLTAELTGELAELLSGVDALIVHNVLSLHKNLALTAALHALHGQGRLPHTLAWCHDFAWRDPLYAPEMHAGHPWELLRTPLPGVEYVVVSDDRRPLLAELFGLREAAIHVINPGLDLEIRLKDPESAGLAARLGLLEADPLLLLPARITTRKNIQQAIRITAALAALGRRPLLLVSGPLGPHNPQNRRLLERLLALRDELGAGQRVRFLCQEYVDADGAERPVSDEMMADLYRLADGLLFTSTAEGFGIPVIEALFDRLPIFCSDIPIFHETAGAAATYFPLDPAGEQDQAPVARAIDERLRADPAYARRLWVRRAKTWGAIYAGQIRPLLRRG